jgi:hypothetical protein
MLKSCVPSYVCDSCCIPYWFEHLNKLGEECELWSFSLCSLSLSSLYFFQRSKRSPQHSVLKDCLIVSVQVANLCTLKRLCEVTVIFKRTVLWDLGAAWSDASLPTFRRRILPPSVGWVESWSFAQSTDRMGVQAYWDFRFSRRRLWKWTVVWDFEPHSLVETDRRSRGGSKHHSRRTTRHKVPEHSYFLTRRLENLKWHLE